MILSQLAATHVHVLSAHTLSGHVLRALPELSARQLWSAVEQPSWHSTVSTSLAGIPAALDKRNNPAAGTGAGGTNYSHGSAYDTGDNVKGYMGTQDVVSSGQGYMTTPNGAGPGFGVNNEGSAHNTGIGVSGAGTGTSGYHHGTGTLVSIAVGCQVF